MAKQPALDSSDANAARQIWRSIFPTPLLPRSSADRKRYLRSNLILHFRPPTVKAKTLTFTLTWGLGGTAVTLVLLQFATGLLLKFVYAPTPVEAYASVQTIITQVPFGRLVRNLHHWSANLLVLVMTMHMLRVFFTGAFHPPRQFNWIIGLFLYALVLSANLSGYLLPYDQLAYWAVTVFMAMVGYIPGIGKWLYHALGNGSDLGPQALTFFYSLHTAVIPGLLAGLMGFHFWRIRRAGGLVVPRQPTDPIDKSPERLPAVPHLLLRELCMALAVAATLMLMAIIFDAPFAAPANPGLSPNPVRAPWYFAGLQELLLHVHPAMAITVIPLLAGLFLVGIPYLAYPQSSEGIWFASVNGRVQTIATATATAIITLTLIALDALVIKSAAWAAGIHPMIRDGVLPLLVLSILMTAAVIFLRKRWGATLNEIVQSLLVIMVTAGVILTLVGVFFRGASMQLIWPF